jgi:hypothetical protein
MNKDRSGFDHNMTAVREGLLGDKLRLRAALYSALGIEAQPEQKESTTKKESPQAESFNSYINQIHSEAILALILEMGKGLNASKLSSFLFALEAEGILKPSFLGIQLNKQDEMVREQFSFNQKKQALSSQIILCKEKDRCRLKDIKYFRQRVQEIIKD